MTLYVRSGSEYQVVPHDTRDVSHELPAGTYTVHNNPMQGYHLAQLDNFEIGGRIYGDTSAQAQRIITTFEDRPASTGVLLSGDKGSGKTLLAKLISLLLIEKDVPTILINQAHHGDAFNAFIQAISTPAVIIFDEFEKVYDRDEQAKLLTLFDGVYPSKKLFVVTSNDPYRISEQMRNRPGRFYYRLDFGGLDADFILAYCKDNLGYPDYTDELVRVAEFFPTFSFDMLKAVVEEVNRFGESPSQALKMLNVKLEGEGQTEYDVQLVLPDEKKISNVDAVWRGSPFGASISIDYWIESKKDGTWRHALFTGNDIKTMDGDNGIYHYTNAAGEKLSLKRRYFSLNAPWKAF